MISANNVLSEKFEKGYRRVLGYGQRYVWKLTHTLSKRKPDNVSCYLAREVGDNPSIKVGGQWRVPTAQLKPMLGLSQQEAV